MKYISFIILAISFSSLVPASDIPCNVIGTAKDPNMIKLLEAKPGSSTPEESLLLYKDQYADAIRCKNKSDAATYKMYIEGLEDAIARGKEKKIDNGGTLSLKITKTDTVSPAVVKNISVDCEDESTKPKTQFKIFGTDSNGTVVAEGDRGQLFVRVLYNNRKPDEGRAIEVVAGGQTNRFSKSPGLGPIGINPGWAMKLLFKKLGMNTDIKITCFPQSQKDVVESKTESKPEIIVDDSDRVIMKDVPVEKSEESGKPGSATQQ